VKDVFNEYWDPHQLNVIAYGGNQALYNWLQPRGLAKAAIKDKYRSKEAKQYKKQLINRVMGKVAVSAPTQGGIVTKTHVSD